MHELVVRHVILPSVVMSVAAAVTLEGIDMPGQYAAMPCQK